MPLDNNKNRIGPLKDREDNSGDITIEERLKNDNEKRVRQIFLSCLGKLFLQAIQNNKALGRIIGTILVSPVGSV